MARQPRGRDWTRYQRAQEVVRLRRKVGSWGRSGAHLLADPRWLARNSTVRCWCSRPCCGNERRHFGKRSVQERRAMQSEE